MFNQKEFNKRKKLITNRVTRNIITEGNNQYGGEYPGSRNPTKLILYAHL